MAVVGDCKDKFVDAVKGVFFGQMVGDVLGQRYHNRNSIAVYESLLRDAKDQPLLPVLESSVHGKGLGNISDKSQIALFLANSLDMFGAHDEADTACSYVQMLQYRPPSVGDATRRAFQYTPVSYSWAHRISSTMFREYNKWPHNWREVYKDVHKKLLLKQVLYNTEQFNSESTSNEALLRIAPIVVKYSFNPDIGDVAKRDTSLSHLDASVLVASDLLATIMGAAVQSKIVSQIDPDQWIYQRMINICKGSYEEWFRILENAHNLDVEQKQPFLIFNTDKEPIFVAADGIFRDHFGIAFQNALYHYWNTESFERAILATLKLGGDTTTNSAVCGAIMGAKIGLDGIPKEWLDTVRNAKVPENNMCKLQFLWPKNWDSMLERIIATTIE